MEYQILNKKFAFNENKNIGSVLYIVEGGQREIMLLKYIFKDILKYEEIIGIDRRGNKKIKYINGINKNSKIFIINSKESNINSITDTEFRDNQVQILKNFDDEFNYENVAMYYSFDCDREQDKPYIKKLLEMYGNSREPSEKNKFDSIGGMMLLNYPALESFVISNFETDMFKFKERFDFKTQTLKEYINDKRKYNNNNMSINTLSNAFDELVKSLCKIGIDRVNLDDTRDFNNEIYEYEQLHNNQYMLSLLLISFVDLGIIEFEE